MRETGIGGQLAVLGEKPPPEWGGVCETVTSKAVGWPEKPPPKRGGVCEET